VGESPALGGFKNRVDTALGDTVVTGWRLDLVVFKVFSNLNDALILCPAVAGAATGRRGVKMKRHRLGGLPAEGEGEAEQHCMGGGGGGHVPPHCRPSIGSAAAKAR